MSEVVKLEHAADVAVAPAQSEAAAILSMIERAARDPAVDIEKLERLYDIQERAINRGARIEYDTAFAAMQPELPEIDKKGKIVIKAKDAETVIQSTPYALWDDTNRLIKPILGKHGFALSFRTGQTPEGKITTTCILSHRGGHREETTMILGHDSTGSKNAVQAIGSSTSYGKRYTACAILNITMRGEDDDGKKGGDPPTITDEQVIELRDIILAVDANEAKFAAYMKVKSLADLKATEFDRAKAALSKKAKQ